MHAAAPDTANPEAAARLDDGAYVDPIPTIDWGAVDHACWWIPPGALSLATVPAYEMQPLAVRRRVSHFEYLHLVQTGLLLEAFFVERLAILAERTRDPDARSACLREIREEAGHSLMFVELLRRSDGEPASPGAGVRVARSLARRLDPASALFWAMTMIGEELPARLTRAVEAGPEEVTMSRVVIAMARVHGADEAGHAAFARERCAAATARLPAWRRTALSAVLALWVAAFERYLFYPPATLYARAGLVPGAAWRARAHANPVRRALVARLTAPSVAFLRGLGWTLREPRQK
ncbi:MAG TPA: diiron oxygenase [Casimicrobiaceae bacterium]